MVLDERLARVIADMDNDRKNKMLQLFIERQNLYDSTKVYLDDNTDSDGKISVAAANTANKKMDEIEEISKMIDDDLKKPLNPMILEQPGAYFTTPKNNYAFGVQGKEYRQNFLNAVRNNFSQVQNYLQIADPTQGGYLLPSEMHDSIIVKLRENNILRKIATVIQTASQHKITIQATAPVAQWTPEGSPINLSSMTFDQKALDAYKLTVGLSISNEAKADSYYNLEEHITTQFSEAIGELEEATFFNGDGNDKPLGLLTQINADTDATITTAGDTIGADDIINLVHKLPRPYRSRACFVMDDTILAAVRKLKDLNQSYLWEPSLAKDNPSQLFGYPVYTSPNMPQIASGNLVILFGDFSKFIIGQRGNLVFRPLYELHALQDLSTYLMLERVDTVLTDTSAIVGLKVQ